MADEFTVDGEDDLTNLQAKATAVKEIGENAEQTSSQLRDLETSNFSASTAADKSARSHKELAENVSDVGDAATLTNQVIDSSSESFGAINDIVSQSHKIFQGITQSLDAFKTQFDDINNLTNAQQTAFTGLNTIAVGVKESFDNLNNIDATGITLMKDEMESFIDKVKKDIAGGQLENVFSSIESTLGKSIGQGAKKAAEQGTGALVGFLEKVATGVDNVRRLTNAQLQLAAATGSLDEMYDAAGDNLIDLNSITDTQHASLVNLGQAYGISNKVLEQHYSMLGEIPGALTDNVRGYDSATNNISALNGALLLASGSGRSFSDIVSDMHESVRNYGLNSDEALTFTSRISEITNNYGLELKDVRDNLLDVSRNFRFFGNEAEGAATMVNTYVNAIKQTGVSGTVALDVVSQMTDGIKNLTLAQKAFISGQTGGPGGLMGAYQIEQDLRDGKFDEVFSKVRETMQKQMGGIVSLEEAAMSPEAAAKFTKQVQIVKQGPLGQFAQDDQSAMRILEGFQKLESGENIVKELSEGIGGEAPEGRQKLMEKGNIILQRNNDALTENNRILERQQQLNNLGIYNVSQRAMGAVPTTRNLTAEESARMDIMSQARQSAQLKSSEQSEEFAGVIERKEGVVNRSGERMVETTRDTMDFAKNMAPSITKSMTAVGKEVIQNLDLYKPGVMTAEDQNNKVRQLTSNVAESGLSEDQFKNMATKAMSGDEKSKMQLQMLAANPVLESQDQMNGLGANPAEMVPTLINGEMAATKLPSIDWENAPENLAASAYHSAQESETVKNQAVIPAEPIQQVRNQDGTITVKVEGICIECNKKTHSSHGQTQGLARRP